MIQVVNWPASHHGSWRREFEPRTTQSLFFGGGGILLSLKCLVLSWDQKALFESFDRREWSRLASFVISRVFAFAPSQVKVSFQAPGSLPFLYTVTLCIYMNLLHFLFASTVHHR